MAIKIYVVTELTGNTINSLDGINGTILNQNDIAFALTTVTMYPYILDTTGLVTITVSPTKIKPANNAGNKGWVLSVPYAP